MSKNGMIPGQEPYTEREREVLRDLMIGALDAEDLFSLDELEEYAAERRNEEQGVDK